MSVEDILSRLEALGQEKVRAHNLRYGALTPQFGVKLGDIRAIAKQLKTDHALGERLWETGNIDARLLATLIMDPGKLSADALDAMVRSEHFSQVADWLYTHLIKPFPDNESLRLAWIDDPHPMAARAGWSLTAGRIARQPEGIDLPGLLDRIDREFAQAHPSLQWTMNTTLANIGIHLPSLRERAIQIGEKWGVYRNFPVSKGCTSPFAPIWIREMARRREES